MPLNILMPALSPTMEEGTLTKWLVKSGDQVRTGDLLAEIETDKATMEVEAVDDGTIDKILIAEGANGVKVNAVIATLLEDGEQATEEPSRTETPQKLATNPASDPPLKSTRSETEKRLFASPLARRIATDRGIDLALISGSGPKGRIVKADVETFEPSVQVTPAQAAVSKPTVPAEPSSNRIAQIYADRKYEEVPLDGMRKTIAVRLTEAKQTIPHFYLRRDIELDSLLAFRADLNKQLAEKGVKISVNDFVIKACALALQDVPACNAAWAGDRIFAFSASDISVAVAIDGGLITPVIRDADSKTLRKISSEMKDFANRARDRKLAPNEYQGGAFSISNLGMMGIDNFDAVINPPQGAILAVGAGVKKPVVRYDEIEIATIMSVTLSVDHRVIDGALGAELLSSIKSYLETPLSMLA